MRVLGSAGAAAGARGARRVGELDGETVTSCFLATASRGRCGDRATTHVTEALRFTVGDRAATALAGREPDRFGDMAPRAAVPDVADGLGTDAKHMRNQDTAP